MTIGGATGCALIVACLIAIAVSTCMICESIGFKIMWTSIAIVGSLLTIGGFLFYFNGTEAGKRELKSEQSNLHGGIERTVTVYDYNSNKISSWSGTFDVTNSEYETYFDIDGKRVVIHGGIVINEEK